MATIDYSKPALVSWTTPPTWREARDMPLVEYFDGLTLNEAVTFVMDHLDARCRSSVIVTCGPEKYNELDIEAIYHDLITASPSAFMAEKIKYGPDNAVSFITREMRQ